MRPRLRATNSSLATRNFAISARSCPYARTTRTPERFSWATALSSDSCAWMRSNLRWIARPNTVTETDTNGSGSSATSVSHGSMESIRMMATTNTSVVCVAYITDGPAIMRTALRSLVARDIKSPVRRS